LRNLLGLANSAVATLHVLVVKSLGFLGVVLLLNGCSAKKGTEVNDKGKTKDANALTGTLDAAQPGVAIGEAPARTSAIPA
jgi:hypothetical protein